MIEIMKDDYIKFRISKAQKKKWKILCEEKEISLTDFVIGSVENRMLDNERREVLKFIESQDNIFSKIENNINQVAKIANGQKFINENLLKDFNDKLKTIRLLKEEQNEMFSEIYKFLAQECCKKDFILIE